MSQTKTVFAHLSKKQQQIMLDIQHNDISKIIASSVLVLSDLQVEDITIDEYNEIFMQVSQYFEVIEDSINSLLTDQLPDQIYYLLHLVQKPLQRNYLAAIFSSCMFKHYKKHEYLFNTIKTANQVSDQMQNIFLRHYLSQSLNHFFSQRNGSIYQGKYMSTSSSIGNESVCRLSDFNQQIISYVQLNFLETMQNYQQLQNKSNASQLHKQLLQQYTFLPILQIQHIKNFSVELLLNLCAKSATNVYLIYQIVQYLVDCDYIVLFNYFKPICQCMNKLMHDSKQLEYGVKQLMVLLLVKMINEEKYSIDYKVQNNIPLNDDYQYYRVLVTYIELSSGELHLEVVLDIICKIVQNLKQSQLYIFIVQHLELLFRKYAILQPYKEFYLIIQLVSQLLIEINDADILQQCSTNFSLVYMFVMQFNMRQAGRLLGRIVSHLADKELLVLKFSLIQEYLINVNESLQQDDYQFGETCYDISRLMSGCDGECAFQLLEQTVDKLKQLNNQELYTSYINLIIKNNIQFNILIQQVFNSLNVQLDEARFNSVVLVIIQYYYKQDEGLLQNFNILNFVTEQLNQISIQHNRFLLLKLVINQFINCIDVQNTQSINNIINILLQQQELSFFQLPMQENQLQTGSNTQYVNVLTTPQQLQILKLQIISFQVKNKQLQMEQFYELINNSLLDLNNNKNIEFMLEMLFQLKQFDSLDNYKRYYQQIKSLLSNQELENQQKRSYYQLIAFIEEI